MRGNIGNRKRKDGENVEKEREIKTRKIDRFDNPFLTAI
jgi:hypothetical protein